MEVWASPEATVARIDARRTRDQLRETGHEAREGDVDLIARLGVQATRYPVLWEKVAPHDPGLRDYGWAERRLNALVERGVEPIVTLLHHGSGPSYTELLDPAFPQLFAAYAAATAQRFPWVRRWTPINEPLTTARFSTLYGVWYPNLTFDHAAFGRAVVNQARAFALAADCIRDAVPDAQFMLTEDLQSFTAGDERIAEYVEHKRERMYLSCELLQGRIVDGHPMHRYLVERCGIAEAEVRAFARAPRPPDLLGWNYYPYSERRLTSEGEGHRNVGVVEVAPEALDLRGLLRRAHARLELPFALSEVHLHGDEAERARWLLLRHADACALEAEGLPVVAVGAWAAFGMVDWNSLLRAQAGVTEDGIYSFERPDAEPRQTLVADAVAALASARPVTMPVAKGWWERLPAAVG